MQLRSDQQILTDKKTYLQSQLGTISPYTPMTSNGRPATPQAQLMAMELQYSDLSGRYGAKHPDVVRLQRQIEVMKQQIGGVDNRALDQAKYSTTQAQLNEALQRYGEKHPEVQRLRRQLDEMKAQMDAAPAPSITAPAGPPDNPMYLQLQNQLADADSQLRGTQRARGGAGHQYRGAAEAHPADPDGRSGIQLAAEPAPGRAAALPELQGQGSGRPGRRDHGAAEQGRDLLRDRAAAISGRAGAAEPPAADGWSASS